MIDMRKPFFTLLDIKTWELFLSRNAVDLMFDSGIEVGIGVDIRKSTNYILYLLH